MDLMEIDPKLFITCRLCLEDTGIYQIVPIIQQQIKYCFEIDVEPFDGLPQLLCKKCHTLLSDYTTVKKIFKEKQETLKEKLSSEKEVPPVVAANSQPIVDNICEPNVTELNGVPPSTDIKTNVSTHSEGNGYINEKKKRVAKSKRRKRVISSSSTESANSTKKTKRCKSKTKKAKNGVNLKSQYSKYYVCNICSLMFKNKRSIRSHHFSHSLLKAYHHDIFTTQCKVSLAKLDDKPNITGLNNTVVFSENRIIQNDDSNIYHILYKAKNKQYPKSDSSDNEIFTSKQNKRRRLNSLSSNDNVYLGEKSSETTKVGDNNECPIEQKVLAPAPEESPVCIDLDDSSDSNMEIPQQPEKKKIENTTIDIKTIENIITVCRNKYETRLKKYQVTENESSRALLESQLKHKLLSFGRKTIYAKGFNSTGLLRYLEHKNLNVLWEPVSEQFVQSASREHTFVKVGTTKREPNPRPDGWTDVVELDVEEPHKEKSAHNENDCVPSSSDTAPPNIIPEASSNPVENSSEIDAINHLVLSDVRSIEETNCKKLLNVNPVANPKQLPKKTYNEYERKPTDANFIMPVITSTTSLAAEVSSEGQKKISEKPNNGSIDKPVPRIKVKSVSELMNSQRPTPTEKPNPIWSYNQNIENGTAMNPNPSLVSNGTFTLIPNILVSQIQNQTTAVVPISTSRPEPPKSTSDYIILHTVDMPNTKTESPFEYLRNLLLLHGIILVEANANISREFVCLLKFKVQFKQENKSNPVTLCLSLHCAENRFCMFIKNDLQINIHIAKMSAIWQWEIIKIYQGDVSTKILLSAQKAGPKIHSYTNTFLCLLKSIIRIFEQ